MQHRKLTSLFLLIGLSVSSCGSNIKLPDPPSPLVEQEIQININHELQTMDGFGASDAWRFQMLGKNWPLDKRNAIADLLFSKETDPLGNPKGIGLSIWRFYLGAGSTEQGEASAISDEWRRGECFQAADGTYDWTKQEGQRWFLQAAKARGVEKYLAFTISPPVHMTQNGKAFAPKKQQQMNIKAGMLPDYADFLVTTIDNLQRNEGITFDYLSPVNEPQWDWVAGSNGKATQEGTPATNQELYDLTKLLSDRLKAKSMTTQIVLGEAGQINYLYENVNSGDRDDQIKAFFDPSSAMNITKLPNVLHTISGHSYFTVWPLSEQIAHRQKLNARLQQMNSPKYWQSEYCILENPGTAEIPGGSGHQRDLGMQTALFVARIMHNDIAVANASSWQWWTAVTRVDYKDGLIYLDDGNSKGGESADYCKNDGYYRESKLLWALGNYSYFVRPGMVRVQIPNQDAATTAVMTTAYKDATNKRVVIVTVNYSKDEKPYKFKVSSTLKNNELTPYVTSETGNLTKMPNVKADKISIPARAIVTYVGQYE